MATQTRSRRAPAAPAGRENPYRRPASPRYRLQDPLLKGLPEGVPIGVPLDVGARVSDGRALGVVEFVAAPAVRMVRWDDQGLAVGVREYVVVTRLTAGPRALAGRGDASSRDVLAG
jgi:hypothetical protein